MSEELRPCPFCGKDEANFTTDKWGNYYVECEYCGAQTNPYDDKEFVIEEWQTRPIEDALNARIAELEAAQARWVPVSERLPEDRATVLVAFKNREILTATYYKRYEGFGGVENYWHIEGWHSGNVTHWMPLPEPPEVQQ